jgi:hypothetical protein
VREWTKKRAAGDQTDSSLWMKSQMENEEGGGDWKRMKTGNSKGHFCSNFSKIQSQRQEKERNSQKSCRFGTIL